MKRLAALASLLLLSACDWLSSSPDGGEAGGGVPSNPASFENAGTKGTPEEVAQLEGEVSAAMELILPDPRSARYANLRRGTAGAICGDVDAKDPSGRYMGPRPFLVTPDGRGTVSSVAAVSLGNAEDLFPDLYIRWCASPEELKNIESAFQKDIAPEIGAVPPIDEIFAPVAAADIPLGEVPAEAPGAAAAPPPPSPPAEVAARPEAKEPTKCCSSANVPGRWNLGRRNPETKAPETPR